MEYMSQPVSSCLESVNTPQGRKRLADYLASGQFPHYEPHPKKAGLLTRRESDGSESVGRFVGRRFKAALKRIIHRQ
jgi:hypothetical protein